MEVWFPAQASTFLTATADDRLHALWLVTLHTGMRRGEVAGLRWKDVDLTRATLTVSQQRTVAAHQVIVAEPKAKSQRQLHLAPTTVAAQQRHRQTQRLERLAAGPSWANSGYVFVDQAGEPYHPQRRREMFQRACNEVGVPAIRFHDYADIRVMPMSIERTNVKPPAEHRALDLFQRQEAASAGHPDYAEKPDPSPPLTSTFPTNIGITRTSAQSCFCRRRHNHDLRHTMASLALQAGVHPKVVQEQLGHSGIEITMDIYSHVPQSMKQDAAERIAGLFEAAGDA